MRTVGLQTHIWANNFRSLVLLGLFPLILSAIIFLITAGGLLAAEADPDEAIEISISLLNESFIFIVGGVLIWFLISWMFHKKMILAMTKSKPLARKDNKKLYDIVQKLCISRGVPMPKLYIINDDSMNAFASGLSPKNAIMSFSKGLLNNLNDKEIEAVAAHELSHIINRDIRVLVISIIFVGIIQTLSEVFLRMRFQAKGGSGGKGGGGGVLILLAIKVVVFIISYLITVMIQLAISRKREFLADAGAVELTKTSEHLISALKKISGDSRIEVIENRSVAQMCIENPLEKKAKKPGFWSRLFSTHPPIAERIRVLSLIG